MNPSFAFTVIVPYFQREPGVLRRCLQSVFEQTLLRYHDHRVQLIVVDDASPHPARVELEGIELPANLRLRILEQANGGPGAARNKGLDEAGPVSGYLAFLDSDDEWEPDHLERATVALKAGASAYFTDFFHLGQQISAFSRNKNFALNTHALIDGQTDLHWFSADMPTQVMTGNLIGTPTVCIDPGALHVPRFIPELRRAGEDYLFWIDLSRAGARWAFSTQPAVRCGRGVNVYAGVRWGTPEFIERSRHELRWRRTSLSFVNGANPAHAHVKGKIRHLREGIWLSLLSGVSAQFGEFARSLRDDPALLGSLFGALRRRGRTH